MDYLGERKKDNADSSYIGTRVSIHPQIPAAVMVFLEEWVVATVVVDVLPMYDRSQSNSYFLTLCFQQNKAPQKVLRQYVTRTYGYGIREYMAHYMFLEPLGIRSSSGIGGRVIGLERSPFGKNVGTYCVAKKEEEQCCSVETMTELIAFI